jgi:hypothetical protein
LYRGIAAGVTGSFATGATYFGLIEITRKWISEKHPTLDGPVSHFCAGALGKPSTVKIGACLDNVMFITTTI